ncbi:MAG: hypothetical protein Q7K54_04870 [Candidatus Parcubacteria bacterium]|nr:hypothetical protein [Candidatus Parcubacteria bacterium]
MNQFESGALGKNESKDKVINLDELSAKMFTPVFKDKTVLEVFIKLVKNLSEKLSTYNTILSDDTSGRLISLVLRKVINEARKRKGLNSVDTYFLASGRHNRIDATQAIKNFLEKKKQKISKALVVTDHIETGQSIGKLVDTLESLSINFDIATLSSVGAYHNKITNRLYQGKSDSKIGTHFYNQWRLVDVEKVTSSPHPTKIQNSDSEEIKNARKDVDNLAEELKKLI